MVWKTKTPCQIWKPKVVLHTYVLHILNSFCIVKHFVCMNCEPYDYKRVNSYCYFTVSKCYILLTYNVCVFVLQLRQWEYFQWVPYRLLVFFSFFFLLLLLCQTDMANWLQRLKSLDCLPCHKICAKVCDSLPQDKLGLIAIAAQIEMYLGSFGFWLWLWLWIWIWIWFWFSETGGHLESVYMLAPSTGAKSFASLNDTCTDCRVTLWFYFSLPPWYRHIFFFYLFTSLGNGFSKARDHATYTQRESCVRAKKCWSRGRFVFRQKAKNKKKNNNKNRQHIYDINLPRNCGP